MNKPPLSVSHVSDLLKQATAARILVLGDVMFDHFIWASVARISSEAPVQVMEFKRESFMPGRAANVAHTLTAFNVPTDLFGAVGSDAPQI